MSGITFKKLIFTSIFAASFFTSAMSYAYGGGGWHGHGGGGGGYYHGGGGGYYHGGGGYYRGGGGYYRGGGWGGWGPGVVIGVPFGGYYAPECQTIRVCNNYGHCWLQQSCD